MIDTEALSCQELVELVTDYLEGALDERDLRAFEAHLAGCDGCTEYLDEMRTTIRVVGTLTPNDLTQAAETALLQAFRDWKRSTS
jgi:anti-sigma factor RsiW